MLRPPVRARSKAKPYKAGSNVAIVLSGKMQNGMLPMVGGGILMSARPTAKSFTPKQGQYLAFIYAYTRVVGRPPAEADMQRHFRVSPPSVHQMVLTLERAGLVRRQPGVARSIQVLVAPEFLPVLR